MKPKLKACPFCAGKKILGPYKDQLDDSDKPGYFLECGNHKCAALLFGMSEEEVIRKWNQRELYD